MPRWASRSSSICSGSTATKSSSSASSAALHWSGSSRRRQLPLQLFQLREEAVEAAERGRRAAFDLAGGDALAERQRQRRRQRVAEKQPLQAVAESVALAVRQVVLRPMFGVDAPADAGFRQPGAHRVQLVGAEAEAARHHRLLQQAEYRAGRKARGRQRQQVEQHARHRVDQAAGAAGNRVRDAARGRRAAEHGVDQRRRLFQVGRDHQHLGRARRVGSGELRQQLVVQYFQLARQRVAGVDFDAAVIGRQRDAARLQLAQFQHRALHVLQQRRSGGRGKGAVFDRGLAGIVQQQVDEGLALLAPGR